MDYYELLGVGRNATQEEVAAAYRRQAMLYHPDRHPEDPAQAAEKFKEIAKAFEVLNDPGKRDMYDRGKLPDKPNAPPKPTKRKYNKYTRPKPYYDPVTQRWYDSPEAKAKSAQAGPLYQPRPLSDYTPAPPKFDIWGKPLTKEEQEEWVRQQATPGMWAQPKPYRPPPPGTEGHFFDAYSNQYTDSGEPDIR